ncbi:hypothetical protein Ga0466249_003395 [Sporomusaceae bacterium BoRhaA]|uniref:hypothetical protein n=1 Tax=Pelorhabdus rhamnosifermentans TaxID=2772457 RepID=UPI001C061003|nr:hypothetical protein [Pelorhabdus rhamnosifermentans]MBU2702268.1 hypothetical protein [Pelorhabdus rhamnosifermentans]
MKYIGLLIREQRVKCKLSKEYIARSLTKPISKQAFAKKERTGNFSFELVKEVADIIGCDINIFLPLKSTKRVRNNHPPDMRRIG